MITQNEKIKGLNSIKIINIQAQFLHIAFPQ